MKHCWKNGLPGGVDTIGYSLIGLVLVAIVPLLAFGAGVAWLIIDQKKSAVATELASTASALRVAVDRNLVNQFAAMDVLASDVSLDTANYSAFQERARRAVRSNSEWLDFGLVEPRSHQVIAGSVPVPPPESGSQSPSPVDEVVRTRKPLVVGISPPGLSTQGPGIVLLSPVVRDDAVRYVLTVVMHPGSVSKVFAEQRLPGSWTGAVVDGRMLLAGRSRDAERFLGIHATPTLADRIASAESGMFTALNQEGDSVYTVFSRSPVSGWSVVIGVPAPEVEGPIRGTLLRLAGAGGGLIAFALLLAAWVGLGIVRRRRAYEAKLRDSEEQTHALLAALPDGILTHRDGRIECLNQAMLHMFGLKDPDALVGRHIAEFLPASYRGLLVEALARVPSGAMTPLTELQLKRGDGTPVDVEVCGASLRKGDTLRIVVIRDISARKQAEKDLRKLLRAVEQSPVSIVITDRTGAIEYVNPRFEQVTGYTRGEAMGKNPRILKSGKNPPEAYAHLWETISGGGEWRGELCNCRKNGELFWEFAAISGVRSESGEIDHYIAVKEDITARKRADALLQETEDRLSAVFHASPIAISVTRVNSGKILEVNEAALRLFGYSYENMIGRTVTELGLYVDPIQRVDLVARLVEQGQVEQAQIDFRNSGDGLGTLELTGRVIELQGEQNLIAMMVDITERKRLEEVHLQAQKLESLGTLAGGIAHDFNNVLVAIKGNTELAARDVGPDHIAVRSLDEIKKASARASELVRRVMAFGRPREAKQEVVELSEVVIEVLKLLRSTLPKDISLGMDFAGDTPLVLADSGQIHEAIVNLTTNAAYAIGPRAGAIEYRLDPVEIGEDVEWRSRGLKHGRYARLMVSDDGCGMNGDAMKRIFDAFYTTKPKGEGTGLGLSMVHGTMTSHGGAVTVESTPGKGSSFALYFPAADAAT